MNANPLHPILAVALVFLTTWAHAAPPTVTNVTPRGAERGQSAELVITGTNLTPQARLIVPFKATQTLLPDAKPNPAQIRIQLAADASVPLGVYPLRLVTEDGVSAPFFFSVDAFPTVKEVEDNNTFDKAQKVPFPCVVDGQCPGGDVDHFRFPAKKGQRIVVETLSARLGSAVLPQLRVTDDRQRLLAADDTQALQGDARVLFTAPVDGDYVVELSDTRYRGGNPAHYRLRIGDYDVIDEVFPLGGRRDSTVTFTFRGATFSGERALTEKVAPRNVSSMVLPLGDVFQTGTLSPRIAIGDFPEIVWSKPRNHDPRSLDVRPPLTINSRLATAGDKDRFQFVVAPGQRWRFTVEAESLGSRLDGVLRLFDQTSKQLALVDDVDLPATVPGQPAIKTTDPSLDFVVPEGVSLLVAEVRDQRNRGGVNFGYRLTIEPATPDFVVIQPMTEVDVPRGGTALLTVPVVRRGYAGPIELTIPDLPPSLTVQGGHIPANVTAGLLTLTAADNLTALAEPLVLRIEGHAADGKTTLHRTGEHRFAVSKDANPATSSLTWHEFALALTSAEPFTVAGPANLDVVKGYPATVTAKLTRRQGSGRTGDSSERRRSRLGSVARPTAAAEPVGVPAVATCHRRQHDLHGDGPRQRPGGTLDVVLQGKAKVGAAERTVTSAAVRLAVHRPFEVQLSDTALTLTPGQTVTLKGKIVRQTVFKEAVQLKLDGLPPGVTLAAPLKPLTAEQTEFQIDLKVDAKFAAMMPAMLTLTCSTTINGAAYAHPPLTVTAKK